MPIDYKKELESAAKSMILVHEPDLLIKMVMRMVVQKLKVSHVGILLQQGEQDTYLLNVSRGQMGLKIPAGFARMDADNPLIRFFREKKNILFFRKEALLYENAQEIIKRGEVGDDLKQLLISIIHQLEIFDVELCIPSYFGEELLGILLLGKKKDGSVFDDEELNFFIALASDVAMAIRNARLFKQLQHELTKRQQLFINTTVALAAAIEAKDHYTHGHTERVTYLSLEVAKEMRKKYVNINDKFIEDLRIAALLHDIGKIGIPEKILNKEAALTAEEWVVMKEHPVIGANILQSISELDHVILGVKYHHERYDGTGYPEGLNDGNIPMNAAIITVADSFDAMTTDRPYRKAKTVDEAVKEIESLSGKQFHPHVVSALMQLYNEGSI